MATLAKHLSWTTHQGRKILVLRLGHPSVQAALTTMDKLSRRLSSEKRGSVRLLADLREAWFMPRLVLEWVKYLGLIQAQCSRVAVLGAHGAIAIVVHTLLDVARAGGMDLAPKVRLFENPDLAREWLSQG